ncbi:MAG: EAL domain-containing protein [Bacillota bacterium]
MKIKNISFKYKILGLALIIITLLTLSIIFTITNTFNDILEDIIFQNEINNIEKNSELITSWFSERKHDLEIYANTDVMEKGSWEEKKNYLETELAKRVKEYYFFFIADENGNYSTTFEDNAGNIKDRNYFPKIMNGNTVISEPIISRSTSKPIIVIGTPIGQNNENKSMLAAVIKLDELSTYINKYRNEEEGIYSFLINDSGKIITHPATEKLESYFQNNQTEFTFPDSVIKTVTSNNKGNLKYKMDNKTKYAFYHNIPETNNWKLVTILPQNYIQTSIDELNNKIFVIGLVAILLGSIFSIYIANNISKPIIKLNNAFKEGATGNLNVKAEINSKDELGEAANNFNKMMDVIKNLTYNDSLTGLPNINFFRRKLKNTLNHLNDINQKAYICSIGVDDFKSINDRFGYNGGDEILQKLANRLTKYLDDNQPVARMGDEFYFYLLADENENGINGIHEKCNQILNNINQSYLINNNIIYLTNSMGVSVYPDDSKNAAKLIKNSSLAMHAVKKSNNGKIDFYAENVEKNLSQRKKLETELSTALEKEQFILHYQPFISTENEKTVGLEALIRWQHPEKGMISPGVFIPIAEDSGFIKEIGNWVLKESCRQLKNIHDNVNDDFFVSVNVSPEQFLSKDFLKQVKEILFETGLDPEHLELEITERTAMGNIDYTIKSLKRLHELGVKIAIDDFGTGYSSLSYLKEFAIDILKIDKSFIDNFIGNKDDNAIVNTIITIGHNLNLKVVAEGVETKRQADKLKELGCDIIQGYYYSKPLAPDKLFKYIDL